MQIVGFGPLYLGFGVLDFHGVQKRRDIAHIHLAVPACNHQIYVLALGVAGVDLLFLHLEEFRHRKLLVVGNSMRPLVIEALDSGYDLGVLTVIHHADMSIALVDPENAVLAPFWGRSPSLTSHLLLGF